MNEYLLGVIGTVIICALLTAILPEGKMSGTMKAITRLACILAIVAPILKYLQTGGIDSTINIGKNFSETVIEMDESYIKYYSEMRIRETEAALEKEISDRYGFSSVVHLNWERILGNSGKYPTEAVQIKSIEVKILGELSKENAKDMYEYLTKNYCSEVLIE